jgi:hypothetical protein
VQHGTSTFYFEPSFNNAYEMSECRGLCGYVNVGLPSLPESTMIDKKHKPGKLFSAS